MSFLRSKFIWAIVIGVILFLWLWFNQESVSKTHSSETEHQQKDRVQIQGKAVKPAENTNRQKPPEPVDTRLKRLPDGSVEFRPSIDASLLLTADNPAEINLNLVDEIFGHYRFAYGENPVGVENFEFTEQLMGKNAKKIVFINAESSAIRGNELIDQWQTPYFFHAHSGQELEIISAGPDKKFWTSDDITLNGNTSEFKNLP